MSEARTEIFSRLQQSSSKTGQANDTGLSMVRERLSTHKRGVLPACPEPVLDRFISKVENVSGTVKCIKNIADLPAAVYEYLSAHNIEQKIVAANSELLKQVGWQKEITIEYGPAQSKHISALTVAYAGIAETGSLVLCSSKDTPTTLNFLPENYICVVQREDIHPYMEDAWDLLRKDGKGMPRAINFITGPSRTADVEQTIQLGAHGPRRLHIIILGNE